MDPGVRSHGMKADPPGYIWYKYECFLMSGWRDILHSSCLHVKLWSNSTNGTEVRTNIRTERRKRYTPRHKCRGYKESINVDSTVRRKVTGGALPTNNNNNNGSWTNGFHNSHLWQLKAICVNTWFVYKHCVIGTGGSNIHEVNRILSKID